MDDNINNGQQNDYQAPDQQNSDSAPVQDQPVQQPAGMPQQTPAPNGAPQNGNPVLSIVALVLGVLALVCLCKPEISCISGALAIVLSGVAIAKKMPGKAMAIAGLVLAIVAIAIELAIKITGNALFG